MELYNRCCGRFLTGFILLLIVVWVVTFPAKGALYQISLYLVPLLVFSIGSLRRDVLEYFNKYGWSIVLLLVLPIVISDIFNYLFMDCFAGQFDFSVKMVWRLAIFPITTAVFLLSQKFSQRQFVFFLTLSFFLHAIAGFAEYFFNISYFESLKWIGRMNGFVFNANPFGLLMAIAFLLAFWGALQSLKTRMLLFFYLFAMPVFLTCCLLSGCRGAMLGLLGGLIFLLLVDRKKLIYIGSVLLTTVLTVVIGLWYYSPPVRLRLSHFFTSDERLLLLKEYLRVIADKIIIGYGSAPISLVGSTSPVKGVGPHNILLEALFRTGMIGLVLLLIFIVLSMKINWRQRKSTPVIALSVCFIVCGLLDHSLYSSSIYQSFFAITFVFYLISAKNYVSVVEGCKSS